MAKQKKQIKSVYLRGTISDEVGDHRNDPVVLKKVEAAKKRLERMQLPKELLKKR
ncbi:hypothetical protein [Longitalea arenae]|uniref:hypothetical protein n=1 Tax=Longitalea arenae TaxID=2812558 RepID=UPI001968214F|nr:hypothetical protein [Longitalea arenae]